MPERRNGDLSSRATAIYREIRQEAVQSGVECDAVTSMVRVVDELDLDIQPDTVEHAVNLAMFETVDEARPLFGAVELVTELGNQGISLAVVSSAAYHPFLEWCLQRYGIRDAFQHVVTSAACGIYKSDPAIYQHTLDLFGLHAAEAVHIGDSHRYDVTSASRIGLSTILLANRPEDDYDPSPDAIISNLGEAPNHLDRLLNRM